MKNYYLFFKDSQTAISFYSEVKKAGIKCTIAPTPREADACCGVSILYYEDGDKFIIKDISQRTGLGIMKFWECENADDPKRFKFC